MENARDIAEEGSRNLVGIIPVAGHESFDFDQPWPDCMMPIGPGYSNRNRSRRCGVRLGWVQVYLDCC